MDTNRCNNLAAASILLIIFGSEVADGSLTNGLVFKEYIPSMNLKLMLEADIAEEVDWRRGGDGPLAVERSQDLTEQLAPPPAEPESTFSRRTKRDRPMLVRDGVPNNYRFGPDLDLGPSPAPALGLDSRIFLSNDGVYHGAAMRYRGEAANLLATTQFTPPYSLTNYSGDLKALQGRMNRIRLATTVSPPRKISTPAIAWIQDPNYQTMATMGPTFRRIMERPGEKPQKIHPAMMMFQYLPNMEKLRMLPKEKLPFSYNPYAARYPVTTTGYGPLTIPPKLLSPIEQFKQMYGTTTKPKVRTRRPRPKIPSALRILPMKDDEYIPEETETVSDENITTTKTTKDYIIPDYSEIDERRIKPNIPRFKTDEEILDANMRILNMPEEEKGYETDTKNIDSDSAITMYDKSERTSMDFQKFDRPTSKDKEGYIDYPEPLIPPKRRKPNNYRKNNIDETDKPEVEVIDKELKAVESLDIDPVVKPKSMPKIKDLEEALKSFVPPNYVSYDPTKLKEDLIEQKSSNPDELIESLMELPKLRTKTEQVEEINENLNLTTSLKEKTNYTEPKVGKSGELIERIMKLPRLPTKTEHTEEMNENLKALLLPEDEVFETREKFLESKDMDYGDIAAIKGIPVRR